MKHWKKWPIHKLDFNDFPDHLKKIKNCPKILYIRGNYDNEIFNKSLAVVGSRNMSRYGRDVISEFIPNLVFNKVCIISGFMYGVDSEAHKYTLNNNGVTVAVLGGGLNCLFPSENDSLYTEILEKGGLVISEYPADFKPTLWSFPQRNRIVSGLSSLGVLLIEAGLKSGSLITARIANEQKRKVYAVPGSIKSKTSEGCNYLIKNNQAKLVVNADEILEIPIMDYKQENIFMAGLNEPEILIVNLLNSDGLTIDEISLELKVPIHEISTLISMMSLKGIVEEEAGKIYLSKSL